jgi:hypothetical protein
LNPRLVLVRTLFVLGLTQLIGWGTLGLIAIVGREMADDLGMSVTAVFAGNSILYLVMGLCAPLLASTFASVGARLVMICGTAAAVLGFAVLAVAHGPLSYGCDAVLGCAILCSCSALVILFILGRRRPADRRAVTLALPPSAAAAPRPPG